MKYMFEVRVKEGFATETYAEAWVRASKLIQQAPGALGTELHRKMNDPKVLIAIAHWDSKASRDAMEAEHDPQIDRIIHEAAECCEVRPIGEFDEPEWSVFPATDANRKES